MFPNKILLLATFPLYFHTFAPFTHADTFSSTNRYAVSIQNQDTIFSKKKFISLSDLPENKSTHFLQLKFHEEELLIGAGTILCFETAQDNTAPFGVLFGNARFSSPYLDSKVRINWYTMKTVPHAVPEDIEFERFNSGKVAPIVGMPSVDFTLPEAYLKFKYKSLNLTIGKEKLRWGPGYKGTLAQSGTALAPFYFYHLNMDLASRVNLSCFLAGYDDDRLFMKEFTGFDTLKSKTKKTTMLQFPSRYGVGQRIDVRINDHIQFGIHELCNFYGNNDLTRYANPLQIYYLGYNSGTNEANMMAGCDINLIFKPFRFYGEFLDDDVTIFDNKGNPNKYAFQLGSTWYGGSKVKEIGFEYTHVSKYTYGHYSILNGYEFWGEPTAWPWGNDQDVFTLHLLSELRHDLQLKFETNYWLLGNGTVKDDWYVDGRPDLDHTPYWPQHAKKVFSFIVGCHYSPLYWLGASCTYKLSVQKGSVYNDLFCYISLEVPGKREWRMRNEE
ncbi:MAG: hypothetical protein JXA91_08085 [Candidatus Thermoplasmatota archaeon]|nr:hypothetical protein [Candidatus Thermoplasmatota archaeon]